MLSSEPLTELVQGRELHPREALEGVEFVRYQSYSSISKSKAVRNGELFKCGAATSLNKLVIYNPLQKYDELLALLGVDITIFFISVHD